MPKFVESGKLNLKSRQRSDSEKACVMEEERTSQTLTPTAGDTAPREDSWKVWREWAAIVLAVFALCTSAATVYFTNLRWLDELRVLVDSPLIFPETGKARFSTSKSVELLFVKFGTRQIFIRYVGLYFGRFKKMSLAGTAVMELVLAQM